MKDFKIIKNSDSNDTPNNWFSVIKSAENKPDVDLNNFHYSLPENLNVLNNMFIFISKMEEGEQKNSLLKFAISLQNILIKSNMQKKLTNNLSKIYINKHADDSVLLEWIYNNFRIGFSFEPIIEESSYYIITDDKLNGFYNSQSNRLKIDDIEAILYNILTFILRNT